MNLSINTQMCNAPTPAHERFVKIGDGATSIVFIENIVQVGPDCACVYKVSKSPQQNTALDRERTILARIAHHPSVIRMIGFEVWFQGGNPHNALIFEHAMYGDVFGILSSGPLHTEWARLWVHQVASGLQHLHQADVAHCDLKPENILVKATGDVMISDFGYAHVRAFHQTSCLSGGTTGYASPEAIRLFARRRGLVTPAFHDVWALGVLAFVIITGHPPFSEVSSRDFFFKALLRNQVNGESLAPFWAGHEAHHEAIDLDARDLIIGILNIRHPAMRPSVTDILSHRWLNQPLTTPSDILPKVRMHWLRGKIPTLATS